MEKLNFPCTTTKAYIAAWIGVPYTCVIIRAKYFHVHQYTAAIHLDTLQLAASDSRARVTDSILKAVTLRSAPGQIPFSHLVPKDDSNNSVTAKNSELIFGFRNGKLGYLRPTWNPGLECSLLTITVSG